MAKQIAYTLTIGGRAASAAVMNAVKQIQIEDHADMADMLRLPFAVAVKEAGGNGLEGFVELNDAGEVEGHFHPPKHDGKPQGTLTINMGAATNVNKFRARFDMLGPATATGATVDPDGGTKEKSQSGEASKTDDMGDRRRSRPIGRAASC